MATIEDLGKEYAQFIRLNRDNPNVVTEIAGRINGLTYTGTGKPISNDDKVKLADVIEGELSGKRNTEDGPIVVEAEDSRQLLKLVGLIRKKTQEGK